MMEPGYIWFLAAATIFSILCVFAGIVALFTYGAVIAFVLSPVPFFAVLLLWTIEVSRWP